MVEDIDCFVDGWTQDEEAAKRYEGGGMKDERSEERGGGSEWNLEWCSESD